MVLPDQAARDIDPAWFEEGGNIRVADAFVVDIMLNASGETYETLNRFAEGVKDTVKHGRHDRQAGGNKTGV